MRFFSQACPEGHYCPEGTKYPEPCRAGTYTPYNYTKYVGPTNERIRSADVTQTYDACILCPGGYKCGDGQVNPEECGPGQYSPPGASQCFPCESGYVSPFRY